MLAGCVTASLVISMPLAAYALETTGDAPIYSFDINDVVVPTLFTAAINPDGLAVKVGSGTSTDQVISKNYGIVNKSSKAKTVKIAFTATDMNTNQVQFMTSEDDVTGAPSGTYAVYLAAVPADSSGVTTLADNSTLIDKSTAADKLNDVAMTASTQEVALGTTTTEMGLYLPAATYAPISGSEVELGTTTVNNVKSHYELTQVGGVSAYTFKGKVNSKADWNVLQQGVNITAVYTFETPDTAPTVISGTNAMVQLVKPVKNVAPVFTSKPHGWLAYTKGEGDLAIDKITKIEMINKYGTWDAYTQPKTVDDGNVIVIDEDFLAYFEDANVTATVIYTNPKGETKTATITVATTDPTASPVELKNIQITSESLTADGLWRTAINGFDANPAGLNQVPQLSWDAVEGASCYAIYMYDTSADNWMHWKAVNITKTSIALGEEFAMSEYYGPYPPSGTHVYEVTVYALKETVTKCPGVMDSPTIDISMNEKELDTVNGNIGNIIGKGKISGKVVCGKTVQ